MLLTKQKFSASTNGRGIKVVATVSPGTDIHTAQVGTGDNTYDEIWIWAVNMDSVARALTIQWGGTTAPDDSIQLTLAAVSGLILVVPGLILQNSLVVKAFAAAANVVICHGHVNKVSP